jgi:hypothetical protein
MTILELIAHIDGLVCISDESLGGQKEEKADNIGIEAFRARTLNRLAALSARFHDRLIHIRGGDAEELIVRRPRVAFVWRRSRWHTTD